jgi:hypothetical protein
MVPVLERLWDLQVVDQQRAFEAEPDGIAALVVRKTLDKVIHIGYNYMYKMNLQNV